MLTLLASVLERRSMKPVKSEHCTRTAVAPTLLDVIGAGVDEAQPVSDRIEIDHVHYTAVDYQIEIKHVCHVPIYYRAFTATSFRPTMSNGASAPLSHRHSL